MNGIFYKYKIILVNFKNLNEKHRVLIAVTPISTLII